MLILSVSKEVLLILTLELGTVTPSHWMRALEKDDPMSQALSVRVPAGVRGHTQIRVIQEDSIKSVARKSALR